MLSLISKTDFNNISIIPASLALSTLDKYIGKREKVGLIVSNALKTIENDYDFVLIDCAPVVGVLMVNALAASDRLLVPVQTEFMALKGLDCMLNTISMVSKSKGADLDYLIVPTMYDQRTRASQEALNLIRTNYSDNVWNSMIPIDTKFRDASQQGMPLSHFFYNSKGSQAYMDLLKHLIQLTMKREPTLSE